MALFVKQRSHALTPEQYDRIHAVFECIDAGADIEMALKRQRPRKRVIPFYPDDPLWEAIESHHLFRAIELIEQGVDIEIVSSRNDLTPLMRAVEMGAFDIMEYLLENRANVHARSIQGLTPLHFAAYHCRPREVRVLIQNGSDMKALTDDRQTALYMTALKVRESGASKSQRAVETMRVLLKAGADVDACDDDDGFFGMTTPLHALVMGPHEDDSLQCITEAIDALRDFNANINVKNMHGNTALHEAVLHRNTGIMTHLLACGVDMYITNFQKHTAAQVANRMHFFEGGCVLAQAAEDPAWLASRQ
jgi:ankyrin repeat protein